MTVYVFSKCKKSTDDNYIKNVERLGIKGSDELVFLNKCRILYPFPYFKKYKNISIFLRAFRIFGFSFFFGTEDAMLHREWYKQVYTIDQIGCEVSSGRIVYLPTIYRSSRDESTTERVTGLKYGYIMEYKQKTGTECPTTGFIVWHAVQDIFKVKPKDVVLVNFYGSKDNSTSKVNEHEWKYEEEYLNKHARKVFV